MSAEPHLLGCPSGVRIWSAIWATPFPFHLVLERLCFLQTQIHELKDLTDAEHSKMGSSWADSKYQASWPCLLEEAWKNRSDLGCCLLGEGRKSKAQGSRSPSLAWQGDFTLSTWALALRKGNHLRQSGQGARMTKQTRWAWKFVSHLTLYLKEYLYPCSYLSNFPILFFLLN